MQTSLHFHVKLRVTSASSTTNQEKLAPVLSTHGRTVFVPHLASAGQLACALGVNTLFLAHGDANAAFPMDS
jgi:hypothetical protein